MSRIIRVENCNKCPHGSHTGSFTTGGAKPCCDHPVTVANKGDNCFKRITPFERYYDKDISRQLNRCTKIPGWCPLENVKVVNNKEKYRFDVNDSRYYEYGKPENEERTRERLVMIAELGMVELHGEQFGYKGVMSGLFIEKIWYMDDEYFADYMLWTTYMISKHKLDAKDKEVQE